MAFITPAPSGTAYDWRSNAASLLLSEPGRTGLTAWGGGDLMDPREYELTVLGLWKARLYGPGYFGAVGN